jgi:hypothetical protein
LHTSFADLDESALLRDENVKLLYDEARQDNSHREFKSALEKIALGLSLVFKQNSALRGLTAGKPSSDDAIRLSGFGVHANDFLALQEVLPRIDSFGDKTEVPQWKQSRFGHPGNWRTQTVEFCLRTFVGVAIEIQGARWIPGALDRAQLYDQQIEAVKDDVEIWADVTKDPKPEVTGLAGIGLYGFPKPHREVLRTLKRGETLRAYISIAPEITGNRILDAFSGGGVKTGRVLDVMSFSSKNPKDTLVGKVLASDVKVTCVPKNEEYIKEFFPELPTIDWEPE